MQSSPLLEETREQGGDAFILGFLFCYFGSWFYFSLLCSSTKQSSEVGLVPEMKYKIKITI
jgi:hypothetical protein